MDVRRAIYASMSPCSSRVLPLRPYYSLTTSPWISTSPSTTSLLTLESQKGEETPITEVEAEALQDRKENEVAQFRTLYVSLLIIVHQC